jgi:4-hydroxy-2-oxoheptanedioate aldolase
MSHPLLRALKANKPALGVWLTNGGYIHARTVAQAHPNLSWVAIDCEHGLLGLSGGSGACAEVVAGIHGANPSARLGGGGGYAGFSESENAKAGGLGGGITGIGPSALVRIPATGITGSTSWQIKYALDAGARGIIVPMVRSFTPSELSPFIGLR